MGVIFGSRVRVWVRTWGRVRCTVEFGVGARLGVGVGLGLW